LGKTENRFHSFPFFPFQILTLQKRICFWELNATVQIGNVCCSKFPKNGSRPSQQLKIGNVPLSSQKLELALP
jgi:hypothetical protein